MTKSMAPLRWIFKFSEWNPSRDQWTFANSCVQVEERERIQKFVFQRDAKAAMSGRLLMRKAISTSLNIPYNAIKLVRTEKGKPVLSNPCTSQPLFNFNVSHQGELAVLASEPEHQVGVDVMKIEYPRGSKTTEQFFETMNRQFTPHEWENIRESMDEWEQLSAFYRHWCLKESYVKAIGTGIGFSLQRLDFHIRSPLDPGRYVTDTKVYVDGKLEDRWVFEETLVDSKHCISVALHKVGNEDLPTMPTKFQILNYTTLTSEAQEISRANDGFWADFSKKAKSN